MNEHLDAARKMMSDYPDTDSAAIAQSHALISIAESLARIVTFIEQIDKDCDVEPPRHPLAEIMDQPNWKGLGPLCDVCDFRQGEPMHDPKYGSHTFVPKGGVSE
jgi:hypothetical protein